MCLKNTQSVQIYSTLTLYILLLVIVYTNHASKFDIFADKAINNENASWICIDNTCSKTGIQQDDVIVSLLSCQMTCSDPPLWPKPASVHISKRTYTAISTLSFYSNEEGVAEQLKKLFLERLNKEEHHGSGSTLHVNISLSFGNVSKFEVGISEDYALSVQKTQPNQDVIATIVAKNYFGARHGIETLFQLVWFDKEFLILDNVHIEDGPKFSYRGLMVDTARNYFALPLLKKVVDGMAMTKMNILHLHLTDASSFPIILPHLPELARYGAYSPEQVYSPEDIKDLREYSRIRGVRLVLEIDAPSHAYAGWSSFQQQIDEKLLTCEDTQIHNSHLNGENENTLQLIGNMYFDLLEMSDDDNIFHIGSDEVSSNCWTTRLWLNYTNLMLNKLKDANKGIMPSHVIMWSSPLTQKHLQQLNYKVTVQFWLGDPSTVLKSGNPIIYSMVDPWYLDCGFGAWKPSQRNGVCDPYKPWQKIYNYRPWVEYGHRELTLGGEVCLWTELVDVDTLETRIWPRTAAFAERLWTDPEDGVSSEVFGRLSFFRDRLRTAGIRAEAIWPRWCALNPGKC